MIIPDTNVLIYAYDQESIYHEKAKNWWRTTLGGSEAVGIPWVVVLAFTRLMTHPQICVNPLTINQTRDLVLDWFNYPHVRLLQPSLAGLNVFFALLDEAGTGGNLSTDALIALHAREYSATVYTNDRDFDRFPGIQHANPLQ